MRFIGLDLAWSSTNPSGVAVLEGDRNAAQLVHWGLLGDDREVLAFLDGHSAGPTIIAVDAPLTVPNRTGKRPGEAQLSPVFGRHQANAHPANRERMTRYNGGEIRGEVIKAALEARGFVDDPFHLSAPDVRAVVEVYPHAAMVALFQLPRTLKYKQKGQGRVALDAAWREYHRHLATLGHAEPGLTGLEPLLAVDPSVLRGSALKNHEDEVDAVMCAYVALYAHRFPERCEVFGRVAEGYILTPTFRERWQTA